MSIASIFGISTAYADAAAQAPHGFTFNSLLLPLLLVVVFYFLLIRPQSKRAKEQRTMLDKITIGDEVLTTGGIVGKISKMRDSFIVLTIAKDTEITMQKASIASVLPKGTLDSI